MSDEREPEATVSDGAAAVDAPVPAPPNAAERGGGLAADGGATRTTSGDPGTGAPRKRRRRGSRGGRNRNKPRAATAAGAGAATDDVVDDDDDVDVNGDDELVGDDVHDAAADRGFTTEDVAAQAADDAEVELVHHAPPFFPAVPPPRPASSGPTEADAEPPGDADADEPAPSGPSPVSAASAASAVAAASTTDTPARRRRRRGGRGRGRRPAGDTSAAVAAEEAERQAAAEQLLDELDEAVLERRRGRTRKGRPVGRYLMCVHVRPQATQIGVLEGRALVEHYVSRPRDTSIQIDGNIYYGKVQNVLPGMEAAFVDIGTPKNGVLYRGDVAFDPNDVEGDRPRIERMLRNGQPVMVQVTKNPIGTKGARLTQEVSLAGRFLVMVPGEPDTYGISKRLPDDERKRLRKILDEIRPKDSGLIVRTAAEGATADELVRDLRRLGTQWDEISKTAAKSKPAKLLYKEPELAIRVIREEFTKEYRGVIIDDFDLYREVKAYVEAITPELADRVEHYSDPLPIFERFHVHEQLHKALDRKVWLPSGGSIIIERTEALTVIDVNTGKNVGRSNLEETVYRNNLEAAEEVARQLRLRDIGGIIVIDFIDMEIKKNREDVLRTFRDALARDKTRTQVFDISELGLVEMTRKRVSEGLVESFSQTCPSCAGRGIILDESLL
jgi:ribonuclease E